MSLKAKILPNYTYQDYCQWEGRWEIIDGIPYAMAPMPSPRHQSISVKLSSLFDNAVLESQCNNCTVYQPIDVKIAENTVVNPDLLIVCQAIKKQYLDFPPALVVEIFSPSTRLKDKHSKYELYEQFGIKYYLMVDPVKNSIEVYQLNKEGKYVLLEAPYTFGLDGHCSISPDFKNIW